MVKLNADSTIEQFASEKKRIRKMYERGIINQDEFTERMKIWREAVQARLHKNGHLEGY